jgi:hypothetical protein
MSEDRDTAHVLSTVPHFFRRETSRQEGRASAPHDAAPPDDEAYGSKPPSREHWMQAACILPQPLAVHAGDQIMVTCAVSRDGLAPRFSVGRQGR